MGVPPPAIAVVVMSPPRVTLWPSVPRVKAVVCAKPLFVKLMAPVVNPTISLSVGWFVMVPPKLRTVFMVGMPPVQLLALFQLVPALPVQVD